MKAQYQSWVTESDGLAHALLTVEGMRCASCSRSIERAVTAIPGVERIHVNVATGRASVNFRPGETDLQKICRAIQSAGFTPLPLSGADAETKFREERRLALKRIGVAGLGSMQVMMYVFGLYVATPGDLDPAIASLLRYVGLAITTPILIYAGSPFFDAAWKSLRQRSLGMDVPIALAMALAYVASAYNTVREDGPTYFDSVTMFIFLLSLGRFIEISVRRRRFTLNEALSKSLPATALRVAPDSSTQRIPIEEVSVGDRLLIPLGAVVPVDATLCSELALIDESLITGESTAVRRSKGERLLSGSVNTASAIEVTTNRRVEHSTLASIAALLDRAQSARPRLSRLADRAASWFVGVVLILAAGVAVAWSLIDPSHAFSATLAVLIITCPCALSLATPVATAAATIRLARIGMLITRPDALERLAQIDTVVFDKTGTLTTDDVHIELQQSFQPDEDCVPFAIAAALERGSEHPIARAFAPHADPNILAINIHEVVGQGIEGRIGADLWRLGQLDFVTQLLYRPVLLAHDTSLYLGNVHGLVAAFNVEQTLCADAADAISNLKAQGLTPILASGDQERAVLDVACKLRIGHAIGRLDPAQKLAFVQSSQAQGHRVLMIGDGVNDGPVLAASYVSCSIGRGSAVAQAASDMVLLMESLSPVGESLATSRKMLSIIRQNLAWAVAYNVCAVPLAALDVLSPWVAALGMSVSSLVVVLNATRLSRRATQLTSQLPQSSPMLPRESVA